MSLTIAPQSADTADYSRYLGEQRAQRLSSLNLQHRRLEDDCAEFADDVWAKCDALRLPLDAWERDAMNYPEYVVMVANCDAIERRIRALEAGARP